MASLTAGTTFTDGVANDVTAAKLGTLITNATPTPGFIQDRTAETVIATDDTLLIGDASDSNNLKRMTVANLLKAPLVSTSGTVDNLTTGTTTSTAQIVTSGTTATFNSTNGTIATLNSTTGTIPTLVATTLITTGTGTAAAPAIVPTGDTNTGIFFPAADTIAATTNGTEHIRIDSSGKVLIGTTSNDTGGRLEVKQASSETGIGIQSSGTDDSKLYFRTASGTYGGDISFNGSYVKFSAGTTERLRIDSSGNCSIGTATAIGKLTVEAGGGGASTTPITTNSITGAGSRFAAAFYYSGTKVGSIDVTGSATAYVTSSDYRLKTNLEPIVNGINRIKQLPVYSFNWRIDESGNKVDGFVAHEAQAIVPESVTGEKDAVDADGNPIYQGIDQSKIVPLLTAALKDAIAKIETLEAKVTALEAA